MPLTYTRRFRVRYYECDAFGHLNNANYLRYMQETAFDASAAAGFDLAEYNRIGKYWLIRETDIEYLRPVFYGDTIEVKTWVMDFHRVRSRRAYEFTRESSSELVARAVTDWVLLDRQTERPTRVTNEMKNAFFPEGIPKEFPPRQSFPKLPAPPEGKYTAQHRVAWQDIDSAQHVNNAVYLVIIEECGMQVVAAHNWPVERMLAEGFAILIRRHLIEYVSPALLNDELTISTWVSSVKRSTAIRHYEICRSHSGQRIATVHSLGVWVDMKSGKPIRIPEQLLADFLPNISPE
jgi:acyl-CoA thioester hydrolase